VIPPEVARLAEDPGAAGDAPARRSAAGPSAPRALFLPEGVLLLGGSTLPDLARRPALRDDLRVSAYNDGSRRLQERFDTTRLADRLEERFLSRPEIGDEDRALIERSDMFFLATADAEGRPQCSYKGGEPGFVRVLDPQTIAFPLYDGNGMYLSAGNALVNPHVGLLFVDFEQRTRLRLNGVASVDDADPLRAAYPEAQLVVRVRATEVFPNCPRYIHRYALVERSRFVPKEGCRTPAPQWKRSEWASDVLPDGDPALAPDAEVIPRG
jgi:uncharacterized protein